MNLWKDLKITNDNMKLRCNSMTTKREALKRLKKQGVSKKTAQQLGKLSAKRKNKVVKMVSVIK